MFRESIVRANAEIRELELFVSVCANGLSLATGAVAQIELVEKINKVLGEASRFRTPDELQAAKDRATKIEAFATNQKKSGLSYLFGLAVVKLWTILETCVDDLVVVVLRTPERCKNQDFLQKLKGPLLAFRNAGPEEQAEFLAETLKNAVDAPLKLGVGRFEAILEPCGLGGAIEENVRRVLLELSQIRNVIVHKAGRTDRRFIEVCPWLGYSAGRPVSTSHRDLEVYILAVSWYLIELRRRIAAFEGAASTSDAQTLQADVVRMIKDILSTSTPAESP